MLTLTRSQTPASHSMRDRASVRGVRHGRPNRKRGLGRRQARPDTVRFGSLLPKALLWVLAMGALVYGGEQLRRFLITSPRLAIQSVEVRGAARASSDVVVHLSGIAVGDNIVSLDGASAVKTIEAHPWVRSARVHRAFPDRVVLMVEEHEPVVLVALGHLYYANREGDLVKRYASGESLDMPVVTGLTRERFETDDGQSKLELCGAIDFLREWDERMGEGAPPIGELRLDAIMGLTVVIKDRERRIEMGHPPWADKISRLRALEAELARRGVSSTRVILSGGRRGDRAIARLSNMGVHSKSER